MWSIGVIVYSLLFGVLPFEETTKRKLYIRIIKGDYGFPSTTDDDAPLVVSNQGKQFLSGLLVTDPNKRWTTSDALDCKWLNMNAGPLLRNSLLKSQEGLKNFNAKLKIRAAMLAINFVTHLSSSLRNLDVKSTDQDDTASENDDETCNELKLDASFTSEL